MRHELLLVDNSWRLMLAGQRSKEEREGNINMNNTPITIQLQKYNAK
jgi:hypothetical protein